MAKSSFEKALEKQQKEQKRLMEKEALRQQASMIVGGQPFIGGMRVMDSSSEEILKIMISNYVENKNHQVQGDFECIPQEYDLHLEFEKLVMYGVISTYYFWGGGTWTATITAKGLTYFDDKEKAKEKEKIDENNKKQTVRKEYDVFISHASKDKSDYVDSLYLILRKLGVKIFYDTEEISWGDNFKQVILDGTDVSEFAIIVISENFFDREWTERELHEFLKRQNSSGQKIVLPLLYNISIENLKEKYPELADIQVIESKNYSIEEITILFAKELIKRLKL